MVLLGIIGGQEIILILIVVLILFGGKKIPELMRGLGKGVKEYKKAVNASDEDATNAEQQNTSDKSNDSSELADKK